MGHADHDFLNALGTGRLDQLVHGGDEAFTPFQGETLLADVLGVQETLQAFGGRQAVQDLLFLVHTKAGLAADLFQLFLPPALLVLVSGIHVLGADGAAVCFAQRVDQFAQGHRLFAEERVARVEHRFLVSVAETIERGFEFRNGGALGALEGIQISPALAHVAVGSDQLLNGSALAAQLRVRTRCHNNLGAALFGALGKSVDDGEVGDVFGIAAIHRRHMLKCIKVLAPIVWHATWVGEVVLVHLFDIGRIAAEEVSVALVGLIDGRRIAHIPLTSAFLGKALAG
ncbi:hypothetical protein D3C71_896370 [compost metagenome]